MTGNNGKAVPLAILMGLTALGMSSVWLGQRLQGLPGFLVTTGGGLISLLVTFYVWRQRYRMEIDLVSVKGWQLAAAAFAGTELVRLLFNMPSRAQVSVGGALFWLVWFIAFTGVLEEFWWRGVWFNMWRGRPFVCVVAGAALFGATHLVQNSLENVAIISGLGLVLGAARYRGASIGSLALIHGIAFNWVNATLLTWKDRAQPVLGGGLYGAAVYFLLCAIIAGLIYSVPLPGSSAVQLEEAKS